MAEFHRTGEVDVDKLELTPVREMNVDSYVMIFENVDVRLYCSTATHYATLRFRFGDQEEYQGVLSEAEWNTLNEAYHRGGSTYVQ